MPLPTIQLIGNLTADPEFKLVSNDIARASFRVACNERKRLADGSWTDGDTTFLSVTCWRALAETVAEQLKKGDSVVINGRLKSRTVEHPEHGKQTYCDVDASSVAREIRGVHKMGRESAPSTPDTDPWAVESTDAPF